MKSITFSLGWLSMVLPSLAAAATDHNLTESLRSKQILPNSFEPPQVFRNKQLVRNINLEKEYPRETINVIIENIDSKPQDEYFLPMESALVAKIGALEVRDKKNPKKDLFEVETVQRGAHSPTEFYRIKLPQPLAPNAEQTLSIYYTILSSLTPIPAAIDQLDKQYVQYSLSAYAPSAYKTLNQKTKIRFPTIDVPDFTKLPSLNADNKEDPRREGLFMTYGPYNDILAGANEPITVRYEYTKPLIHATLLQRDVEISHWGGNLATEERFWLGNRAARLKKEFSRVEWQMRNYGNYPTSAIRELKLPLYIGASNAYFTDDIGNVSTSRFRRDHREVNFEVRPRYPVFGGWKYSFRVGWDADLKSYLRKLKKGDGYILKVPFLEGPKMPEGVEYDRVEVKVILPEGARNVRYETAIPLASSSISTHCTFMDTIGRPTLELVAINVVDEWRDRDVIVTYDYPFTAGFRKPMAIFSALIAVFGAAWAVGSLDVSIGKK